MADDCHPDFDSWSPQELQRAEAAAVEFLHSNIAGIADTFDRRLTLLHRLMAALRAPETTFEQRMLYFSLVEEVADGMSVSAREFFDIGCLPSVANLVRTSRI